MRVALVYRRFSLGGSLERDVVLLARALVDRGVDVHCYCNPDARSVAADGVVFHDVRPLVQSSGRLGRPLETASFAAAATRALRRDRRRYDVVDVTGVSAWESDVITVHGVTRALQGRWPQDAGRNYRAARARAAFAPLLRPQVGAARAIERLQFASGRSPLAIAVTDAVARDLTDVHGVPPWRIEVIPPPVEIDSFRDTRGGRDIRDELGIGPTEALLLFVGHDFARKGLDEAIAALAGLPERTRLVVVGAGNRGPFEVKAREKRVADRVLFVGGTEAPAPYFAAADLLLLPTRQDPWGITLIEAMAARVPVVTSAAAGASVVVRAAGAGIVVEDPSPAALVASVASLLGDPVRRRELGARGAAAAERFGVRHHVDRVLRAYERAREESRLAATSSVRAEPA